jgi:N utilization substance protein B
VADPRRQVRILALQGLCHLDAQGDEGLQTIEAVLADHAVDPAHARRARRLALGAWTSRDRYDAWVQQVSEHWDLTRMAGVERSILRLAIHELMDCREPPAKVAIDEAIELAKMFGAAESAAFVNGILDAVWQARANESIKSTS